MGHYHGTFPENVQQDKRRHTCGICKIKKYKKFMYHTRYENYFWVCKKCGSEHKIKKRTYD